ncbi:porin [Ottowia sp.]|uniref:porin n=1 Tax=Ottowia sp. TaxID=1898956 RepID=UPI003A89F594
MKKSLIALAVLGLSSAAMAQSSVTLYGVADAGVGQIKSDGVGSNDASTKTEFLGASTMNNGTSRLGVRGVEDLGGGLQVGFNFETGLDLDNGAQASSGGTMWGRQANMWLGGNWGTVKLGRQFTPSYLVESTYDLTGAANYSALANTYNYGTNQNVGSRAPSAFAYVSPTFYGFKVAAAYVTKHDLNGDSDAYDLGALYNQGPIAIGASVNKVEDHKTAYQVGGKYNFGMFAVAGSYSQTTDGDLRRRGFSLGASANWGAFTLTGDVTRDSKNELTGKKYTNGVVEAKYALSKRTFVYGAYLRFDGDNNWGLGVRHNF